MLTKGYGSELSRLGTAFHEAARAKVRDLPINTNSLRARYGLTDDEVRSIEYGIYNITIKIPKNAVVLADDKKLTGLGGKLTGTPDFGIIYAGTLTVVDWKSGWGDVEDPETNNQLIGYALLIIEELKREYGTGSGAERLTPEKIVLMVIQPKINQVKTAIFTIEEILKLSEDIRQIIKEAEEGEGEYTTGPWCQSCFKSMNCPAFVDQIKTLARYVEPAVPGSPEDVERALRVLLPFAKSVGTVSRKVEAVAKAWVDHNGPLDLGGGQIYAKVIGEKKEVNAWKALEVLVEYFGDSQAWTVMSASMTKITELAVATKRGLSTIVKNRMIEVGALTSKISVEYRIIKGGNKDGTGKGITDQSAG